MSLTILYRGDLSSCNYGCKYCPFAKQQNSREELHKDKADLNRFVTWVENQKQTISILFTPWGEALIRGYYRDAITKLSHLEQVQKVVIQTNFTCSTNWLNYINKQKVAFWITYHPSEIKLDKFVKKCTELDQHKTHYSVGTVGIKENFDAIIQCRKRLSNNVYLWINAYKRIADYYTEIDLNLLNKIDPHFNINNQIYPSRGKHCLSGEAVISVDGGGNIRRCHFIKEKLGNIYNKGTLSSLLKPRSCSNINCSCYIGYIHLPHLNLETIYGQRILERIATKF